MPLYLPFVISLYQPRSLTSLTSLPVRVKPATGRCSCRPPKLPGSRGIRSTGKRSPSGRTIARSHFQREGYIPARNPNLQPFRQKRMRARGSAPADAGAAIQKEVL
jgi:hypothetical protein